MTLMPKKTKFRKSRKGHLTGLSKGGTFVDFGEFGIQVLERGYITAQQIEACRVAVTRFFSRRGKVWIRIFPDMPFTQKPAEVKMGKGKGEPVGFVAEVKPGRIMFEIDGVENAVAAEALRKAGTKLPIKTKIVSRV